MKRGNNQQQHIQIAIEAAIEIKHKHKKSRLVAEKTKD